MYRIAFVMMLALAATAMASQPSPAAAAQPAASCPSAKELARVKGYRVNLNNVSFNEDQITVFFTPAGSAESKDWSGTEEHFNAIVAASKAGPLVGVVRPVAMGEKTTVKGTRYVLDIYGKRGAGCALLTEGDTTDVLDGDLRDYGIK